MPFQREAYTEEGARLTIVTHRPEDIARGLKIATTSLSVNPPAQGCDAVVECLLSLCEVIVLPKEN